MTWSMDVVGDGVVQEVNHVGLYRLRVRVGSIYACFSCGYMGTEQYSTTY